MDIDSNYSTDVTIREAGEYVQTLTSNVTKRKGRGFQDNQAREEIQYEALDDQSIKAGPAKCWILIVTNIHKEATEEDINNVFGEFGVLKSRVLNIARQTGHFMGYALLEYESYKEAEAAQSQDKKLTLFGQTMGVDWAFSSGPLYGK